MLKWIKRGRVSKCTKLYGSVRRQEALSAQATLSSSLSTEQNSTGSQAGFGFPFVHFDRQRTKECVRFFIGPG